MTTQRQLPDRATAHDVIVDVHKRAFFGRLRQLGAPEPQNEKEAAALLDLGVGLMSNETQEGDTEKAAADNFDYGDGPYAQALYAFDEITSQGGGGAPGFEDFGKRASNNGSPFRHAPQSLPPALKDAAWNAALQLAQHPTVYASALVKRAENEEILYEYAKQAGLIDENGNPVNQQGEGQAEK